MTKQQAEAQAAGLRQFEAALVLLLGPFATRQAVDAVVSVAAWTLLPAVPLDE